MSYRAPNSYARFVKTAGAALSPGESRIMGLVGTGLNYYEIYNEAITRNASKPYDTLTHPNVFEILSVSSKPIVSGKNDSTNVKYAAGTNFSLKNSQLIAWEVVNTFPATKSLTAAAGAGSQAFATNITCEIDSDNSHLVEDGLWVIEVSYVDDVAGAYRIKNNSTQEIIGEYGVADNFNFAIPGLKIKVVSTKGSAVGDYVEIQTIAGKTETEATCKFAEVTGRTATMEKQIATKIINPKNVIAGTFDIKIIDITDTGSFSLTQITKDNNGVDKSVLITEQVIVNDDNEYIELIPGVAFKFSELHATAVVGDIVRVVTTPVIKNLAPLEGETYYVSYKYKKAAEDYEPKIFFDYDDIVEEYGNYDVTASGIIINSLSLGAEIAFLNGLTPIVCVQAQTDSDYEMKAAIDKLKRSIPGVNNINTIVPLTESTNVGAHLMAHIDLMSSPENGKERMGYLAAGRKTPITKAASTIDKSIGMIETAKSYKNERIVYVVPGELVKEVRDLNSGRINDRRVPGCYAAVAVAALGLRNDAAEPLTNKTIAGFKELTNLYMESEKNKLAEAGCLVLEQRGSTIRVRHGITTSTADVNSNEVTLVQIKDVVIDACRKATADLYIGNKNRPSIVSDVQYTINNILNQFISQEIIIGFNGLTVKRNKDNPTQIDVKFEIEAVYPLNYINISFGFAAVS